jgi:hypothetical protein
MLLNELIKVLDTHLDGSLWSTACELWAVDVVGFAGASRSWEAGLSKRQSLTSRPDDAFKGSRDHGLTCLGTTFGTNFMHIKHIGVLTHGKRWARQDRGEKPANV